MHPINTDGTVRAMTNRHIILIFISFQILECNIDTSGKRSDRRVDRIVCRTGKTVSRIKTVPVRPVDNIVAGHINPKPAHLEFTCNTPGNRIADLRILEVQIAGGYEKSVGHGSRVLVAILPSREIRIGILGCPCVL